MASSHHLAEERLFACYLAERSGEAIDPPNAEHLADCRACAAQYAQLADFLNGLRAEGDADVDAIFTPERMRAQQQQIAKRLDQVGRSARVISFPGQAGGRAGGASGSHVAPKWLAAAAAAGLFLGVGLGASYEWETHLRTAQQLTVGTLRRGVAGRPAHLTPVATRGTTPAAVADDDAFLSDLDAALERPRTRELMPFDALTPHVRDVKR